MKNKYDYPTFKVDEGTKGLLSVLEQAIPQIKPQYFSVNPRFADLAKVTSCSLVDYMGVYESGDLWVLTIIKINHLDGATNYIFLPLSSRIAGVDYQPQIHEDLPIGLNISAFGKETNSKEYGLRKWELYDALADIEFQRTILRLFSTDNWLDIMKSEKGQFNFQASKDLPPIPDWNKLKNAFRISDKRHGCIFLNYHNAYQIEFSAILNKNDTNILSLPDVLGEIVYVGENNLKLVVGVVKRLEEK